MRSRPFWDRISKWLQFDWYRDDFDLSWNDFDLYRNGFDSYRSDFDLYGNDFEIISRRQDTSFFGPPFTEATALVLSTSRPDIFYYPHSWTAPIFTPPYRILIYSCVLNVVGIYYYVKYLDWLVKANNELKKVKNPNWHEADQLGVQGWEQHLLPAIFKNGTQTCDFRIKRWPENSITCTVSEYQTYIHSILLLKM